MGCSQPPARASASFTPKTTTVFQCGFNCANRYVFNLRDVSKVITGICAIPSSRHIDSNSINRLMIHEANRVFRDRLVDDIDRAWFDREIDSICTEEFGIFLLLFL
jgi:hypothetical protein